MNSENSEIHLSAFIEMTPDLVCIAGRDGYFKKVNRAVIEKFGYTREELMSHPIAFFMHPEDRQLTLHKRAELFEGKSLVNFRNRYITKNRNILWLEWTSLYFPDEAVVFAIAKDITKRRQMEVEIEEEYRKFKGLATHFKSSIEEDRKYLARELHEELAQLASILKMDIESARKHLAILPPAVADRIENAALVSQQLIMTIRRLSFSISPNMLEHLGLNATLEWHCKEFSILSGISCVFQSTFDDTRLTDELRIDLFRIGQEALQNILKHAQATGVKVTIEEAGGHIRMTILDNGKGFDQTRQKHSSGLIRMRERAASINAVLSIESTPGRGTTVTVTIPGH
ncbi:MAG TPA: PAS domain-containing sensor histidine kinase [Puia sp.]|nr:PAS domain-containing sensor histidine kinase [Puia sp.]